jgi:hypothetical protein
MANKFCNRCGRELAERKRFCGGCGSRVSVPAQSIAANPEAFIADHREASQQNSPEPKLWRQSVGTLWIALATAAALIIVSVGVWGWHHYSHRAIAPGSATATQKLQPTPAPQSASQQVSSNLPEGTGQTVNSVPPKPKPSASAGPEAPEPPHRAVEVPQAPLAEASTEPVSAALPVSVPEHSGVLHYHGPPVPLNGQVIFGHLPAARLRFTFDKQAWALTIKLNPDGSKRVFLTSLKPGFQDSCDLGWEVVE